MNETSKAKGTKHMKETPHTHEREMRETEKHLLYIILSREDDAIPKSTMPL